MSRSSRRPGRITAPLAAVVAASITAVASIVVAVLTLTTPKRDRPETPVPTDTVTTTATDTVGTDKPDGKVVKVAKHAGVLLIAEAAFRNGTDELLSIVKPVRLARELGIAVVPVDETWVDERVASRPAPALLIIHSSAFQYISQPKQHEKALFDFIATISARHPSTKYLVYNAGFCDATIAARWKSRLQKWMVSKSPQSSTVHHNVDTFGFGCAEGSGTGAPVSIQASVSRILESR